jgi:hypothetical protein
MKRFVEGHGAGVQELAAVGIALHHQAAGAPALSAPTEFCPPDRMTVGGGAV